MYSTYILVINTCTFQCSINIQRWNIPIPSPAEGQDRRQATSGVSEIPVWPPCSYSFIGAMVWLVCRDNHVTWVVVSKYDCTNLWLSNIPGVCTWTHCGIYEALRLAYAPLRLVLSSLVLAVYVAFYVHVFIPAICPRDREEQDKQLRSDK